jgi:signal transduction histidine kinase/CheY-like chemotaxis protein
MIEPILNHSATERVEQTVEASSRSQVRFGLRAKIILLGAGVLIPLAILTWFISVESLRRNMTEEFTGKGVSIAQSLANSAVDPILTRDASTDQALVDQYVGNSGVAYVLVYDAHNAIIAHTFVPRVPPALIEQHRRAGAQSQQVREIRYADPATGTERQIIDVAVPMLAGRLGMVHVGMDQAIITAAATRAGNSLLLVFAAIAALSVAAGALFARRMTKPLTHLMDAATRVGRGDLSALVPITSRDEIGLLAATFNDTIVRLRSQMQTEAERDQLRKLTTYMEQVYRISTAMQEALSLKDRATRILAAAHEVVAVDRLQSWAITPEGDRLAYLAGVGLSDEDQGSLTEQVAIPLADAGAMALAYRDKRPLIFDEANPLPIDLQLHRPYSEIKGLRSKSFVAVPMITSGRPVGVLLADNKYRRVPIPPHMVDMLPTFASHAAVAVENIRLLQDLQARTADLARSVEELKALAEVGRAVSSTLDLDTVLATIISRANQLSGTEAGWIYEYDDIGEELHLRAAQNIEEELVRALRTRPVRKGEGVGGRVVEILAPFQVPDITAERAYQGHLRDVLIRAGYRAFLGVPLMREQQVIGVLLVGRKHLGEFPREAIELLTTFASQSALAMQNARLFRQLEIASQYKSTFLANMSHELRTPLNSIIGYSEMLQEDAVDLNADGLVPDLKKVNAAGKHLLELINSILDLSKIEAGKMELHLEDFSIARMVEDIAAMVRPLTEKNGNQFEVRCDSGIGIMHADLTKVRQVLLNLLSNACKFTEKGTVSLAAQREGSDNDAWLTFSVKDTGIGLTSEQMGRLFQEFSQADTTTARKYGGTGLGLALSRRLCRLMGGEITVASEPDRGSTFTVRLPIDVAQIRESPTEAEASAGVVLVIDDEAVVRELMQRFLSREGFRVLTAANGEAGLRLAREQRPDAITLDVIMPGMDGWAVLSALMADRELADIPVIMLTIVDDKRMGYALGASEYLIKPIDRARLITVLEKYRRDLPVLVVDDDASTRQLLRRILEEQRYTVVEAENGRAALVRMNERGPGAILLDLMMPEMDGFEFLGALHAREAWRQIPVVIITAKDLTSEERERLNSSVVRILQKGAYGQEELLAEVRALVAASIGRRKGEIR